MLHRCLVFSAQCLVSGFIGWWTTEWQTAASPSYFYLELQWLPWYPRITGDCLNSLMTWWLDDLMTRRHSSPWNGNDCRHSLRLQVRVFLNDHWCQVLEGDDGWLIGNWSNLLLLVIWLDCRWTITMAMTWTSVLTLWLSETLRIRWKLELRQYQSLATSLKRRELFGNADFHCFSFPFVIVITVRGGVMKYNFK